MNLKSGHCFVRKTENWNLHTSIPTATYISIQIFYVKPSRLSYPNEQFTWLLENGHSHFTGRRIASLLQIAHLSYFIDFRRSSHSAEELLGNWLSCLLESTKLDFHYCMYWHAFFHAPLIHSILMYLLQYNLLCKVHWPNGDTTPATLKSTFNL